MAEEIVVRTEGPEEERLKGKDGLSYSRVRFHKVDLKQEKVIKNWFPAMMNSMGDGMMLRSDGDEDGPVYYIIGGLHSQKSRAYQPPSPEDAPFSDEPYYTSATRLNYGSGAKWEQIDLPIKNRDISNCATLFGKVYEFGYVYLHTPEVFDPSTGFWKELSPLPPHLLGCQLSHRGVIPDPSRNRFLLHLSESGFKWTSPSFLYAFYPDSQEWELFGRLRPWDSGTVVLVGDVLYIHDHERKVFFFAYDVEKRQELKVVWSSKYYDYSDGHRVNVTRYNFDALFYAGDASFWMATWSPFDHNKMATLFFKFKVDRPDNDGPFLTCTPLQFQTHILDASSTVSGFLQLERD